MTLLGVKRVVVPVEGGFSKPKNWGNNKKSRAYALLFYVNPADRHPVGIKA